MNVLVTGGAGFIGSHVVDALLARGHRVAVLDDLTTGLRDHVPKHVPLYQVSVCDAAAVVDVFEQVRPDAVVHCAAQIKVHRSIENPSLDREINLVGTEHVVAAAWTHGVGRFVFLSTGGAIYGETPTAASETTIPAPRNYYGIHKLAAEYYVALSGLPYVALRLSNVYGPRQRSDLEGGVISIFIERLLAGKEIVIYGTGEQALDFVYVADAVAAVCVGLERDLTGIYNVATGTATSLNQILATLVAVTGRQPVAIRHDPPRPGDVLRSCLDVRKLVSTGYWRPRYDLARGLSETLAAKLPS